MPYHVSTEEFDSIAAAALDTIPTQLRARMDADNLMITVQQGLSDDDRRSGVNEHVLGYFQGSTESTFSPSGYPKRIVLLQSNIEHWCRSRAELVDQVSETILHEVAHYFGMNHADIDQTRLGH